MQQANIKTDRNVVLSLHKELPGTTVLAVRLEAVGEDCGWPIGSTTCLSL